MWRLAESREEEEGLRETPNRKARARVNADNGKNQRKIGRQQEYVIRSKERTTLGMKVREGIQIGSK